jgi:riboflavin kinase / FMN adenylyltransferase
MEVVFGPEHHRQRDFATAVSIGAYDGVHLGHRHLIGELRRMATARELRTVVVTFDRHPATVVRPQSAPLLLTDLDQKLELLAGTGLDEAVVVEFDEARANETAEDFVMGVLVDSLHARLVVVGRDFHFGHGRKGNVALLSEMGREQGFEVLGLGLEADRSGEAVSSTRVRAALASGDVRTAEQLLGRHHQVRGIVVMGSSAFAEDHGAWSPRAKVSGVTARVEVPLEVALPAAGVYAAWYERPDGARHQSVVSVAAVAAGQEAHPALEVFLPDLVGELPAETARVAFVEHLRGHVVVGEPPLPAAGPDGPGDDGPGDDVLRAKVVLSSEDR